MEQYETAYVIFNHDTTQDSLAIMWYHEAENPFRFGMYTKRLVDYNDREIQKFFGLSFKDFIQQPRHLLEEQIRVAEIKQAEIYRQEKDRLRAIENK